MNSQVDEKWIVRQLYINLSIHKQLILFELKATFQYDSQNVIDTKVKPMSQQQREKLCMSYLKYY